MENKEKMENKLFDNIANKSGIGKFIANPIGMGVIITGVIAIILYFYQFNNFSPHFMIYTSIAMIALMYLNQNIVKFIQREDSSKTVMEK